MLIKGTDLNHQQKSLVLASFGYRWTTENEHRARLWYRGDEPTAPLMSDADWLDQYAFHFIKSGERMDQRKRFCVPSFMVNEGEK